MISAALEAIKGREWPRTEAEIHLLRSAMFAAKPSSAKWKETDARIKSSKSAEISQKSRPNCLVNRRRKCEIVRIQRMTTRDSDSPIRVVQES